MDGPSAQYRVRRELESLPGYEGAFDELVETYRVDFNARQITAETLNERKMVQPDGYLHQHHQELLLYPPVCPGGESRVSNHIMHRLGECFDALARARKDGQL